MWNECYSYSLGHHRDGTERNYVGVPYTVYGYTYFVAMVMVILRNVTRRSGKADPPIYSIKVEKMRGCLLTIVGLLCLPLAALPKASSQSCARIKSDIQQDTNCGTLLNDVEVNSVPQPDIIVIQRACASGQCRSNMDNYMFESSCGSVSSYIAI